MKRLFDRKAGYEASIFAEARSLMDDGLDLEFVLGLFPEDAAWLRSQLELTAELSLAYASEPPSFVFEARLRQKFLAAPDHPRSVTPAHGGNWAPAKTAATTLSLATAAGVAGVVTLGFVTASNAVPGDWNYSFKLAGERIQYALSRGQDRVNVQIGQAEARVYEIQVLSQKGDVSKADITRLQDEVQAIANLAQAKPLDDVQKARLQGVAQTSQVVLRDTQTRQPALEAPVIAAGEAIHAAVAVALAATPTPTITTASPSASATVTTPTPSATPGTPTAVTSATPQPTTTATPPATTTPGASPTPQPHETPSPSATTEQQSAGGSTGTGGSGH